VLILKQGFWEYSVHSHIQDGFGTQAVILLSSRWSGHRGDHFSNYS